MSNGKSFYERKVRYLDYYEGQMRIGSGGFVKLEVREGKLWMDMSVTGLHVTDTFARDVVLCGKGRERVAGRIDISGGKGRFWQQWQNLEDIGGTGIGYGELQGIRVPLGAGREVSGRWPETSMPAKERPGAALSGGRRSEEGYAWEASGTREESRKEERIREGNAKERYDARETEAGFAEEQDRKTLYERNRDKEESYRGNEDIMPPSGQMDIVKGDSMKPKGNQESFIGMQGDIAVQTEERGSQEKIIEGVFEKEQPAREMSEKESAAVDQWKVEEDTETGAAPKESEIRAMEGGEGDMAKASRGEAYYSREGRAAHEEIKSRENSMSMMDSSGFGGHTAGGDEEKRKKTVYETDRFRPEGYASEGNGKIVENSLPGRDDRPGGYASEDGRKSQEHARYGTDSQRNIRNNIQNNIKYRKEKGANDGDIVRTGLSGSGTVYGGKMVGKNEIGYNDRNSIESRNGDRGRKIGENGTGYNGSKVAESRTGYEDRRTAESRASYEDRRTAESRVGYDDRRVAESRVEYSDRKNAEKKRESKRIENSEKKQMKPMEDKWPQLWAIYPHIRPFQDAREYLSISPADFVLFPATSYRSVNNSFLLHGYYNYKHLILARVERKGEVSYYIGVPGNFYEREKQVAIMFGFESFECAEEPAQVGDFGYYMMRTEL